jgi:hypothetical protein
VLRVKLFIFASQFEDNARIGCGGVNSDGGASYLPLRLEKVMENAFRSSPAPVISRRKTQLQ